MDPIVSFTRWFNLHFPINQHKHSLRKLAEKRPEANLPGLRVYPGIQGLFRMELDLSLFLERWMYLHAFEIPCCEAFRIALRPGDRVVDAGANIGFFTLLSAALVGPTGHVTAFEPMPGIRARLQQNLALNPTLAERVKVDPRACWSSPGQTDIHEFGDDNHGLGSLQARAGQTVVRKHRIETCRIDNAVQGPVRLIKMDIEGAEVEAMRGAQGLFEGNTPHVIVEFNPKIYAEAGHDPLSLVEMIAGFGDYDVWLLTGKRRVRTTLDKLRKTTRDDPRKHDLWFAPR